MAKKTDKKEAVVEKAAVVEAPVAPVVEAPKGKKLVSSRGKSWYEDVE
tara:strand:+ start:35 stop:178 length:144 start_codon:yes stop_codon:yes gene_type:complete